MTRFSAEALYSLLPSVYRIRDAESGEPLKALCSVLAREAGVVEDDILQLYENLFIETCDEWVIPYIGDMLGVRGLSAVGPRLYSQRGYVANTLSYRRRKGTLSVLEQLAFDVTGWSAKAVEFFRLLATTQNINHVRSGNLISPDLRNPVSLDAIGTPFETTSHCVDVRRISQFSGRYNIPNIGLFIWRLQPYTLESAEAFSHGNDRFSFSPLGNDMPLFNYPDAVDENSGLAGRTSVPDCLDRRILYDELEEIRKAKSEGRIPVTQFFQPGPPKKMPFSIFFSDESDPLVHPENILICNLENWIPPPAVKQYSDSGGKNKEKYDIRVVVDPKLGRIIAPGRKPGTVFTTYTYCFSGDIGGGPYDRPPVPETVAANVPSKSIIFPSETVDPDLHEVPGTFSDAVRACNAWAAGQNVPTGTEIVARIILNGNQVYEVSGELEQTRPYHLVIQAGTRNRPVLRIGRGKGPLPYLGITSTGGEGSKITFDGLLICGGIRIKDDCPSSLAFTHCTLVPGLDLDPFGSPAHPDQPSIVARSLNRSCEIEVTNSISGPIFLPEKNASLSISDSVIDSPGWNVSAQHRKGALVDIPAIENAGAPGHSLEVRPAGFAGRRYTIGYRKAPERAEPAGDTGATGSGYPVTASGPIRILPAGKMVLLLPVDSAGISVRPGAAGAGETAVPDQAVLPAEILEGGALPVFPAIRSLRPSLNVSLGSGSTTILLGKVPESIEEARSLLETALQDKVLKSSHVTLVNNRLVIFSDEPGISFEFGTAPSDRTTAGDLRLVTATAAISSPDGTDGFGPPVVLERTTIFGRVNNRECTLASDVIFTGPVRVGQRQTGCIRFSYVPVDSATPPQYRCQPALAVSMSQDILRKKGITDPQVLLDEQIRIQSEVHPVFTSEQYGDPGYAQLGILCGDEIARGACGGQEMGVFFTLRQPDRKDSLQTVMDEYLRLGLELGIIYMT
jgi:hypothetical protein